MIENSPIHIILADDDADDRFFFKEALAETTTPTKLKVFPDGEKLMDYISKLDKHLPGMIFLDINMPRKDGKKCLEEIRGNAKFKNIPVIMFSTSSDIKDVDESYSKNANLYIQKPMFFADLVSTLNKVFSINWDEYFPKPQKEKFVFDSSVL